MEGRRALIEGALDVLFPPHCLVCSRLGSWGCGSCLDQLEPPLRRTGSDLNLPGINQILAAGPYHDPILRTFVQAMKYRGVFAAEEVFRRLLMRALDQMLVSEIQAIIPLPATPSRVRERGFDQALVLAKWLSELRQIPVWEVLRRQEGSGIAQATIEDEAERQANAAGVFEVDPSVRITGSILLVDDVVTTGATMRDAIRSLQLIGYERGTVACLAVRGGST